MVGRPTAVVLASPASPVAASPTSNPRSRATAWASPTSGHGLGALHRRVPVGRQQLLPGPLDGGRGHDPLDLVHGLVEGGDRGRPDLHLQGRPVGDHVGRLPPRSTPTLQVTPGQRPFRAARATVLWAASSTALTPSVGRTPAWTALPVTSMVNAEMPLRAETRAPLVRPPPAPRRRRAHRPGPRSAGG